MRERIRTDASEIMFRAELLERHLWWPRYQWAIFFGADAARRRYAILEHFALLDEDWRP